jgi:uncharacterized membrane protein
MFGITPFEMFHTVIALIAVVAGLTALAKYREIGLATAAGRVYVLVTIATCVTGLSFSGTGPSACHMRSGS